MLQGSCEKNHMTRPAAGGPAEVPLSERKPPGVGWESFVDRQIREARERGEFDDLPGAGRPIADLDRPRDDLWWVKEKLRREEVSYLPPTLSVRKEREDALDRILRAPSEAEVRRIVAEINRRILEVNRVGGSGPPSTVMPLDVEDTVARWRERRG